MSPQRDDRNEAILQEAKSKGFIRYGALANMLPDTIPLNPEVEQFLSYLEEANIRVLPDEENEYGSEHESGVASGQEYLDESHDVLEVYWREVAQVPPLSPERERKLAEEFADQGKAETARKELMESQLGLVIHIAKQYRRPTGASVLDLIQCGNEGLMAAAAQYKTRCPYRFATLATVWVHRSLSDSVRASSS